MRCKAFSFVEVLVVIAIIVVVTAISFPIWAAAKKRAKESGTIANLKQTWVSIELYRQDYDGSGKSVGDGHDLGLPNQDGFAVLLSKLNLNWWRVPGR
ncbi:MAG: prepilin-type N-terminal cleavage/methylation domain-containing protein, partial [Fimbriimonadaceae bacterium]|nr:prepilin-type N-terminal cleavage/methylation domain-containing protein [Fimbriimonadaceae bacterium]